MRKIVVRVCVAVLALLGGSGAVPSGRADDMSGYTFVHDPSMIKEGHTYYLFSTGDPAGVIGNGNAQIRTSTDLRHWRYRGTVFQTIPGWVIDAVGEIPNLWAPDISYYHGLYHLYYAGSTFGTSNSVIGLATNKTLDLASPAYHWVDRGLVIRSTTNDDWNAIDPNLALDAHGNPWLAFGSFWSGIKLIALDPATGKPAGSRYTLHALAYRPGSNAVEAPFIVYRYPYYYLFVSFDHCCEGVASTYRIIVGRASQITGPYLDRAGRRLDQGGGTQLLASNGYERGPGGQSVTWDGAAYLLVYHYYDGRDSGNAKVQVRKMSWTPDGWPRLGAPLDS
ncbi:MAG TPA: arabinan endo-1,5-alpha-L-arabinosidase [Chloroflexota bacterium]|nr:arabinan endo-1,5-alpha-L-arabinosidase [Chloroflexota bacterium]